MFRFFFPLCVVLVVFFAFASHAFAVAETIYWNDSDLINFPAPSPLGGTPDDQVDPGGSSGGEGTGTSGSGDTANTGNETPVLPPVPSTSASEEVVSALGSEATVTIVLNNVNANQTQNTNTGGQDLLTLLSSGGAILAGLGSGTGGGSANGSISGGSSTDIRIVGTKVRGSLRSSGIFLRMLADFGGFGRHAQTRADLGLVAASTVLADSNIEEVFFKLHEFTITYRSRGYLFGFVPISYMVRITVNPELKATDRVKIKLPWYRFFIRKLFSPTALANDINKVITVHIQNPDPDQNSSALQAKLFVEVATLLKSRIDVVEESLGQIR